jgi:hypothetical protein
MKTSNFKKYKGEKGVSIAIYSPPYFKGPSFLDLAPKKDMFYEYKAGKFGKEEYTKRYYKDTLDLLDPKEVYDSLKENVLLCWEDPGEFCHRRIVAEWLEEALGIEVPEWKKEDDEPNNITTPLF